MDGRNAMGSLSRLVFGRPPFSSSPIPVPDGGPGPGDGLLRGKGVVSNTAKGLDDFLDNE